MNPKSPLQQQFPLSPKKFWKKMISKLLGLYIIGGVICLFIFLLALLTNGIEGLDSVFFGIIFVVIAFVAFVTALYVFYIRIYIREYYYAGEENFITIKKGVFAPAEIHVQWQKIQDVYVDQDILDRIMGLYDVHIASATVSSGIEAHIDGVEYAAAEGLKKFFLDKVSGRGQNTIPMDAQGQSAAPTAPAAPRPATITLPEEISSKTYPLSSNWMAMSLLGQVLTSIIGGVFFSIFLFVRSAHRSPLTWNPGSFIWGVIYIGVFQKNICPIHQSKM